MPNQPKKLIEVALPVKEISAESVRDKSIRHGHISTLHLWWARRPLPVCRAVVIASLVPDPLDPNCPQMFKEAVELLLGSKANGGDPYKPYDDIPYTAAIDPMEDNLRNRLLMFIGKFSPQFIENEKKGKKTSAKNQLSDYSLITWDNKNNEKILQKARKLIWVAHNSAQYGQEGKDKSPFEGGTGDGSAMQLLKEFDQHWNTVKQAEKELYSIENRHLRTKEVEEKEATLQQAVDALLHRMPKVFDPFAGGGAIPLEAARLGCRSYGNDLNPVAHIIQKGSLEFPQKFGKPIRYTKEAFINKYGRKAFEELPRDYHTYTDGEVTGVELPNRLSYDVGYYAKKLLSMAEEEIGHFYPKAEDGKTPIAYYWARVGSCSNPSCQAKVPLLKQFYLCKKRNKKVHLKPIIKGTDIQFEIRKGEIEGDGWNYRGNLRCPCCGNTTDVKEVKKQGRSGGLKEKLLVVITDGENGKEYRKPTPKELEVLDDLPAWIESIQPTENMHRNSAGGDTFGWGIKKWGQLFSNRQLAAIHTFIDKLDELKTEYEFNDSEYSKAISTYLSIWLDRIVPVLTAFGRWDVTRENVQTPFSRQAISYMFDYPEAMPFGKTTGSALNQLDWIIRYIEGESSTFVSSECNHAASGDKTQFNSKELSATVTDPPYYDAIAYADLSDFFYVWLKRTLGDIYPMNFATPQTPKSEECTALKHHHNDDHEKAMRHFERKLSEIFKVIEQQTDGVVSIMFAHQSTTAWTTLCNSILGAQMNITGSWAIDTEMGSRMTAMGNAALESSVTVSCRPAEKSGFGDYKTIRENIEEKVKEEVKELYRLGFRGADLLTACFGQAVSEFGQYERVEKADGTQVTVAELLEMAREAAFNAIISDIEADDVTRFYIGWLNLFGFTEAEHDDVRRITQIGLNLNIQELQNQTILVKNGTEQSLADSIARLKDHKNLGMSEHAPMIDKAHKAMQLYLNPDRQQLLAYLSRMADHEHHPFWRVLNSLSEVLPADTNDHEAVMGLLTNKESLLYDLKQVRTSGGEQQLGIEF